MTDADGMTAAIKVLIVISQLHMLSTHTSCCTLGSFAPCSSFRPTCIFLRLSVSLVALKIQINDKHGNSLLWVWSLTIINIHIDMHVYFYGNYFCSHQGLIFSYDLRPLLRTCLAFAETIGIPFPFRRDVSEAVVDSLCGMWPTALSRPY